MNLYLSLGTAALLVITAGVLMQGPRARTTERFQVRAEESGGRVRLDWNPASALVQQADAGALEVVDGGASQRYNVAKKILSQGGLDYHRRSDDVLLQIQLLRGGQVIGATAVRVVSPVELPPAPVELPPAEAPPAQ
jgi:hypothetical protein